MKSQLPDRKLQTSCKNCTFAVYTGNTQTGCAADRINKFDKSDIIEAYDNEKEFYVVNKFCNLYRPQSWNRGQADLAKALGESALDFDLLVNCNHISDNLRNYLLSSLENIEYDAEKLNVNLFHEYNASSEIKSKVLEIYSRFKQIKISVCVNSDLFLHELALKSKKNCHLVIDESFDFGSLSKLNNFINHDLKRFIVANCGDTLAISNMAYKMNYANEPVDNYNSNIQNIVETSKNIGMYVEI